MDLIHKFLNLVAPPFTFFSLCLFLPPYLAFKSFISFLSNLVSEDVAGKVVLITGASSGIGEHLAYAYAKRGACLVLAARREKALRAVADRALELGSPEVVPIRADVSMVEDCKRLVDDAVNHFGRLDHLVNNAGVTHAYTLEESTDVTNLRPVMDINFWGSVYTTRFAASHLKQTRGKIVVMSSCLAWLPMPRMSVCNASKAALKAMFETLRVEFGPDIGVTIVTPGFIESELTQGKYLERDGKMVLDPDLRDVQVSAVPVESARACAEGILSGVCRGDRYITEPAWVKVTYYWKAFFPELIEWIYRVVYMTSPGESHREAMSKKIVDLTGAKNILYPPTLQSPQVKIE